MPRTNSQNWSAGDQVSATRLQNINQDLDDVYSNGTDRLKVWVVSWLDIQVWSWTYRIGSAEWIYAGGTATLTDNSTNYIMLTGGGVLNISTSTWDANFVRLAKAVTSGGNVTSLEIWKPDAVGWILGGGWFKNISSTVYNWIWQLTSFDGDGVTYTLTYNSSWKLETITNWTNIWTASYDWSWRLTWLVES